MEMRHRITPTPEINPISATPVKSVVRVIMKAAAVVRQPVRTPGPMTRYVSRMAATHPSISSL